MPEPVFVEREFTARKGRKRTKLRLRVFAPAPQGRDSACAFELRAGSRVLWSLERPSHGVESLQALLLALRIAALTLLQFESDTGMKIDTWHWADLVDLVGDAPISTHDRERVNEIKTQLRELMHEFSDKHWNNRRPSAASREPRAARRTRKR